MIEKEEVCKIHALQVIGILQDIAHCEGVLQGATTDDNADAIIVMNNLYSIRRRLADCLTNNGKSEERIEKELV